MGSKFEVWIYVLCEEYGDNCYEHQQFWRGQSFIKAVWNLMKAKRTGSGCVKLEWR